MPARVSVMIAGYVVPSQGAHTRSPAWIASGAIRSKGTSIGAPSGISTVARSLSHPAIRPTAHMLGPSKATIRAGSIGGGGGGTGGVTGTSGTTGTSVAMVPGTV